MKSILAIAVLSSALALEAARPIAETERMMKENAYQGTWLEKHHDEALKVAFATNGWMVMDYRGCPQLFRWKSNGKGRIQLALGEEPEKTVAEMKYLPREDIMDCGFEGKTTQLDFTGRLAFKSTELSEEAAESLRGATFKHELYREERFERLKKSGDPRLKRVDNLKDVLDPNWLTENRAWVETVDLEYPKVITSKGFSDAFVFIDVIYGACGIKRVKKHEIYDPLRFPWKHEMPPDETEAGFSRAVAQLAKAELEKAGAEVNMFCCQYGSGAKKWHEEGLSCFVERERREKVAEILSRYFSRDSDRYVYIGKAKFVDSNKRKPKAMQEARATGSPQ